MIKNKDLKRRILEISYKHKLSHLGSCLTAVDIIDEIYSKKKPGEKFILSSGHAGLALYVVLEKYQTGLINDGEHLFNLYGVHPKRDDVSKIYCSTGSLGQGVTVAVGMALADRSKNVYCLISDGEIQEGSCYEALNVIQQQKLFNLKLYLNRNGWTAYRPFPVNIDNPYIYKGSNAATFITSTKDFPFLKGLDAHYHVMTEEEYKLGMEILS